MYKYLLIFTLNLVLIPTLFAQQDSAGDLVQRREIMFQEALFAAMAAKATENPKKQIEKLRTAMDLRDDVPVVYYELSKVLFEEGEGEEALHYAYKAAELDPENYWIVKHFSNMLAAAEMFDDLLIVLEELKYMTEDDLTYDLKISEVYAAQGQYKKAIKKLNQIEKASGIVPDLAERKKNIWLAANKPKKARKELEKLVKTYPNVPEFWGALANFHRANDNSKEAVRAYEKLLELRPDEPRAHFGLAEVYRANNQTDKFLHHLNIAMRSEDVDEGVRLEVIMSLINASMRASHLRKDIREMLENAEEFHPNSHRILGLKGDFHMAMGEVSKAVEAYEKAVALPDGKDKNVYTNIVRIHLEKDNHERAVQYGMEALEIFPNQNELHLFTGIALMENKQDSLAAEILLQGYEITFGNPDFKNEFRRLLGEAYQRAGMAAESDIYFNEYLKENPDDELTLNNYAYYLALRNERLEDALIMTEKSNQLSKNNPTYLDTWAWVLYQKGDYKKAREIIERAIELDGGLDPEVRDHYGDILIKLGKKDLAIVQWKKAIELGGDVESIQPKIQE
ncbi:MAG: tetratricopeptide repeat protein [Cryomorphaceae bacterium]|nr:tetratricopeptide repeat protein [Cryomorphaceae bacterium]